MRNRILLATVLVALSLSFFGCATIFSSQHRTEDYTPVFASATAGDVATVQTEVQKDPSLITATEWDHATLLHAAVQENHQALADLLLKEGGDVNAVTDDGLTPLHMAAQNGNIGIARILLQNKANINALDSMRWTPLDRAEKWDHPQTAAFLRRCGAKNGLDIGTMLPPAKSR